MEQETIFIVTVSVFSAAWVVVLILAVALFVRVNSLRRAVQEMQATGRIRVQKLKMTSDKNHAFQNPGLAPDEELSRRGYSMYMADDAESGRGTGERQTGGQFVEELTREIDNRHQRQVFRDQNQANSFQDLRNQPQDPRNQQQPRQTYSDNRQNNPDPRQNYQDPKQDTTAPPFLLQAIEENKRKSRLNNPVAGRASETNPNFIY